MMLDESKSLILENGEIIPAGAWFVRHQEDGDGNIYYQGSDGRDWGTQESCVRNQE